MWCVCVHLCGGGGGCGCACGGVHLSEHPTDEFEEPHVVRVGKLRDGRGVDALVGGVGEKSAVGVEGTGSNILEKLL